MYPGGPLLLCTTLLLGCFAGGRAETKFVLSIPASLTSGQTTKVCVNLLGCEENLDLKVVLNHDGKNTSIFEEDIPPASYFQCADLKVPNVAQAMPVAVIFTALGKTTDIRRRKSVVIKPAKTSCVLQMDKPIYKPGQTVNGRVICLDMQLKAVNEKFPAVYLTDPSRTRIAQWTKQETTRGVFSLKFPLIKEAPSGSYSFRIERESGNTLSSWFTVEEYVKPRYSVKVDAPNTISVMDKFLKIKVSARYTYGEPVSGDVIMTHCKELGLYGRRKNCIKDSGSRCSNTTGRLAADGTFNTEIDTFGHFIGSTSMSIRVDVVVVEDGTGIQTRESHYAWATNQPARISYDYDAMSPHYRRGLIYHVVGKLTDEKDQPLANEDVHIEQDGKLLQVVQTDSEGKIYYGIDTTDMLAPNSTVKISYQNPDQCYYAEWRDADYPTAEYTFYRSYSKSGSFLQAKRPRGELRCGQEYPLEVEYIINPAGIAEGATKTKIFHLVMSNSKIVHNGQQDLDLSGSLNGTMTIALPVNADMTSNPNVVVYAYLGQEIIAETVELNVEKCFKNEVSMTFGQEKGTPGSEAEVLLSGDPESLCGLRVVDYSLMLLNRYESFSASSIFNMFRTWASGYNIAGIDVEDQAPPCEDADKLYFHDGHYLKSVSSSTERDSYQNIKDIGLLFFTDGQLRKPVVCDKHAFEQSKHHPIALESVASDDSSPVAARLYKAAGEGASGASGGSIESMRTDFSENMMWQMITLGKEGHGSVKEKAPDSITKWQGTAFCLSDKGGFGMTKYPANYTTYQPLFLQLSMPYSFIRGETLVLVGVVYNYLEHCVKIRVTLEASDAFTAELKEGTQDVCVCSNGQTSYVWEVQARHLGEIAFTASAATTFNGQSCDGPNDASLPTRKDTVIDTILVLPEGVSQERTLSDLVLVKGTKSVLPVSITPPDSVVPDSISASIAAVGDIFGLPASNLHDMVKKPYGCGEQVASRMAVLSPVIDYLNKTDQLKADFYEKAKGFMMQGYYQQLGFASGGAYKVFPGYGEGPNSWLTALVFATLEDSKQHIYIDPNRQQQTLIWLQNTQRLDTGCFRPQGRLFMKQNVDADLHFTAFLAISVMKSGFSLGMTLLDGAMECLKTASTKDQATADEAIMAYAFTLAGLEEYRVPLMQKLMKKANVDGGAMHWQREDMPTIGPVPFFLPISAPAEVAMTSYMLLSMTAQPTKTDDDMIHIAQTSLWLTRQMNSNGGFGSTSDTVVAIKALAATAELMHTPNAQQTVRILRGNAEIGNLVLDQDNRLLVHRQPLPEPTGGYSVEVEGTGWCLIQTRVKYNIPIPQEKSAFSLALSTTSDNCIKGVAKTFNITVTVSYHGNQNASNMAIVKLRMLSGYIADYWTLRDLVNKKLISRHEESKGELTIYLNSVSEEEQSFTVRLFMDQRVLNVKRSSAYVYDYYQPDDNGYGSYSHPCAAIKS